MNKIYSKGFPYKKYINYSYYKKNILLNNYLKDENRNSKIFDETRNYISKFQETLKNKNIENYITSGYAIQLYLEDNKNIDKKIVNTYDIDLVLFYKDKELNNNGIIFNLLKIIDSCILNISNEKVIYLNTIINFEDINNISNVLNIKTNKYKLYFVKIINKVYVKIKITITNINKMIINNIYSYNLLKIYSIKDKKKINNYLPIELIIAKKIIKSELITTTINKNNKIYYVYNEKFIIYNLMNLYHNYITLNVRSLGKIKVGKDKRDHERLYYILELYLKKFNLNNDLNNIFSKLKSNYIKFKTPTFKIKEIDFIDKIIKDK